MDLKKAKIDAMISFLKKEILILEPDYPNNKLGNASLWGWSMREPMEKRLKNNFENNVEFKKQSAEAILDDTKSFSVLDVGSGFCMYWPYLNSLGYNNFIGVDLYHLRNQGNQRIKETAEKLIQEYCKDDINYKLIQSDIRNIKSHKVAIKEVVHDFKFDLILGLHVQNTKKGSTGIPADVFDRIVNLYLKDKGVVIYNGRRD
jgi:hypothetical protein